MKVCVNQVSCCAVQYLSFFWERIDCIVFVIVCRLFWCSSCLYAGQWCTDMEILQSEWIKNFFINSISNPYQKFKIVDSNIQTKSETAHSVAHEPKYLAMSILPDGQKFWLFCFYSNRTGWSGHVTSMICTRGHGLGFRIRPRLVFS